MAKLIVLKMLQIMLIQMQLSVEFVHKKRFWRGIPIL